MVKKGDINETSNQGVDLQPLPMAPATSPSVLNTQVYRLNDSVAYPSYQTERAGCMDLAADLSSNHMSVKCWDPVMNRPGEKRIREDSTGRYVLIEPGERLLIATGLIFVFPEGFSMTTFIRSSVGLKKGLALANGVGYIDEDYREELFIPIINNSRGQVRIDHCERLAQAEIRPSIQVKIDTVEDRPSAVGNRNGGFGSTGSK
jgi:dUTP pyrophosphatase